MKQTLEDLQIKYIDPITINCDNTSAISISKNTVMHSKNKHILIKYHFLRDHVTQEIVKIVYLDTKEQIADIFTKPLPMSTFENLRQKLGVIQKPH
jgi:energy-converting hydrogenase A subunit M